MAGFEYGGGGEDLSGGSTGPFDTEGYIGFDPRLSSQHFDESQRFDESFRAPSDFHPTFGEEPKEEVEDEFKGANGYGYHQAENPPAYGFEDQPTGQPAEASAGYEQSFEPDPNSEFVQGGGGYTEEHGTNGNGFGVNGEEDDTLFSSIPPSDGPILPPPEEMREEGLELREWKRHNAIRLQEKERSEKEKLAQIIEEADDYKDSMFEKRKTAIENGKKNNRDKEKTYLQNQEMFHKESHKHYWKAVGELIPNELPTIDKGGKKDKKDKKPGIIAIKGPKPGRSTDMTRLRQVLVKLKHNPPEHMKYKPPPPPAAEKDKDGKDKPKDKDGKDVKDKDAAPTATEGGPTPAAAPGPAPVAAKA